MTTTRKWTPSQDDPWDNFPSRSFPDEAERMTDADLDATIRRLQTVQPETPRGRSLAGAQLGALLKERKRRAKG